MSGLYIHIPFCAKKCAYCDFISYSGMQALMPAYVDALIKESKQYKGAAVSTVFIGGGTPSFLYTGAIEQLIKGILENISIAKDAEFTIECNPCSVTNEKLNEYKNAGINRISLGAQSFDPHFLVLLGRSHSPEQFNKAYSLARDNGFDNINIDLMFALPGQTLLQWSDTLQKACQYAPEHISCYSLTIEEHTPMGRSVASGALLLPEAEAERAMYYAAEEVLQAHGYAQYEISNYAKVGCECRHNINYWLGGEYIGLGCAAHSYRNNIRYGNTADINEYINASNNGMSTIAETTEICTSEQIFESVMLELRMNKGLDRKRFFERFGRDITEIYGELICTKISQGFLTLDQQSLRLTSKGRDFADGILIDFLSPLK